jgi:hypothetical protein
MMIEHQVFFGIDMNQNPEDMGLFNTSGPTEVHQIMLSRAHLMREQGEKDCLWDPGRVLGKHPAVIGVLITPVHRGFLRMMNQRIFSIRKSAIPLPH